MVIEDNTHKKMCPQYIFLFHFPLLQLLFLLPQVPSLPAPNTPATGPVIGYYLLLLLYNCAWFPLSIKSIFAGKKTLFHKVQICPSPPSPGITSLSTVSCWSYRQEHWCDPWLSSGGPRRQSSGVLIFSHPGFLASDHRHTVLDIHVVGVTALVHFAGAGVSQDEAAHSGRK